MEKNEDININTYSGEVDNKGEPHGYGILYNADGTIGYEGEWKDGVPVN